MVTLCRTHLSTDQKMAKTMLLLLREERTSGADLLQLERLAMKDIRSTCSH